MDGGKHETYGVLRCECSDEFALLKDTDRWSGYSDAFSSFRGDACAAKRGFSISVDFPLPPELPNVRS